MWREDHHSEELREKWTKTRQCHYEIRKNEPSGSNTTRHEAKPGLWLWIFVSNSRLTWFMLTGVIFVVGLLLLMTCDNMPLTDGLAVDIGARLAVAMLVASTLSMAILLAFWRRYKYRQRDE